MILCITEFFLHHNVTFISKDPSKDVQWSINIGNKTRWHKLIDYISVVKRRIPEINTATWL